MKKYSGKMTEEITIELDCVPDEIVENLVGVFGNTKAEVIDFIVKDWIFEYQQSLKYYNSLSDRIDKKSFFK